MARADARSEGIARSRDARLGGYSWLAWVRTPASRRAPPSPLAPSGAGQRAQWADEMRLDGTTGASARDFSMRAQESSRGNPMDCRGDLRVGACASGVRDLRDLVALTRRVRSRIVRASSSHVQSSRARGGGGGGQRLMPRRASEPRERGVDRYRCDLQFSRGRRGKL